MISLYRWTNSLLPLPRFYFGVVPALAFTTLEARRRSKHKLKLALFCLWDPTPLVQKWMTLADRSLNWNFGVTAQPHRSHLPPYMIVHDEPESHQLGF
jgi:hypothetical protein